MKRELGVGQGEKTRQRCQYTSYFDRYKGVFDVDSLVVGVGLQREAQNSAGQQNKAKIVRNDELVWNGVKKGRALTSCAASNCVCRVGYGQGQLHRTDYIYNEGG